MEQALSNPQDKPSSTNLDTVATESAEKSTKKSHPLVAGFNKLTMLRQLGLLIGLAAAIALGLAVVLFTQQETYKPLLTSANNYNTQEVIQLLQQEGVDFTMNPVSGIVLVSSADLHRARLAIAGANLNSDPSTGLELLDQGQPLGTSQFMENKRYMRGLEGELSRTIASIRSIRNARVHLAIPKESVFVRDKRQPSASVMVELFAGGLLEPTQVKSIRNLVANSIPELSEEMVMITDQSGYLYEDNDTQTEDELTQKQFEYTQKREKDLLAKINGILIPILGADNFEARVNADIDFTKVEQAEELYNPDTKAERSVQNLDEKKTGQIDGGVPGALTNQPPGDAQAPEQVGEGGAQAAPPTSEKTQSTVNYEIDRTVQLIQKATGEIKRLTVAVVVNHTATVDADGNAITEPLPAEQLNDLKLVVQNAVGFDVSRGDSVDVINAQFKAQVEQFEDIAFWQQPWFWDIAKQVLAGLFVLILIFGVLRPAVRGLMAKGEEDEEQEDKALESLTIDEEAISDDKVTLSGADEFLLPGPSESFERQLDALRGLVAEDPGRVALVLRKWIMSDQ